MQNDGAHRHRRNKWVAAAAAAVAIAGLTSVIFVVRNMTASPASSASSERVTQSSILNDPLPAPVKSTVDTSRRSATASQATAAFATSAASDSSPKVGEADLARCGDTLPQRPSARMAVRVDPPRLSTATYSVTVVVTDQSLWGKPLSVIDQIEIVRGNEIVGIVTNVAPVLRISRFDNADSKPQDQLTVPASPRGCGEGSDSFGSPLEPGRYQLYVEAVVSTVSETFSQKIVAGVISEPSEITIR